MAYRFAADDKSVQAGVRDIALELIEDAIECTGKTRGELGKRVHSARKCCKKLRGLIRLVRPVFDDYEEENARFRDAARELSSLRDAGVLIETYDGLLETYQDKVERSEFAAIRRQLTKIDTKASAQADAPKMLRDFCQEMEKAHKRASHWRLGADGFAAALEPGIKKSYKGARRAMDKAARDAAPETFHEWRKRVKDHWYHVRLLCPIWRKPMKTRGHVADELGDLLGKHHDLEVFALRLAEDGIGSKSDIKTLAALARRRQKELEEEAFCIGARLLAEPTGPLLERWQAYWKAWHAEKPREAALSA